MMAIIMLKFALWINYKYWNWTQKKIMAIYVWELHTFYPTPIAIQLNLSYLAVGTK